MVRKLARTMGRTAVISGTATAAAGRVAHRQQQKFAQQGAQPPQAAAPPHRSPARHPQGQDTGWHAGDDLVAHLQQLTELRASGALSDEEFAAAKAKLLAS